MMEMSDTKEGVKSAYDQFGFPVSRVSSLSWFRDIFGLLFFCAARLGLILMCVFQLSLPLDTFVHCRLITFLQTQTINFN